MRRFFATVGSLVFLALAYGFTAVKLVLDTVGRISSAQNLGEKNGYTAKVLNLVLDMPWWVPAIIALIATLSFLYFFYSAFFTANNKPLIDAIEDSHPPPPNKLDIVGGVFAAFHTTPSEARIKPAKTLNNVYVYIESSTYIMHYAGGWTAPNRVLLKKFDCMPKGEMQRLPLFKKFDVGEYNDNLFPYWKFGQNEEPNNIVAKGQYYRCAIYILGENDAEKRFCFIIAPSDKDDAEPCVIGGHMFSQCEIWEGKKSDAEKSSEALYV